MHGLHLSWFEADEVADRVMRMSNTSGPLQRMCTDCEDELQQKSAGSIQRVSTDCGEEIKKRDKNKEILIQRIPRVLIQRIPRDGMERSGQTLPYAQANALADCIRIMGEDNSEYCRERILNSSDEEVPGASERHCAEVIG